MFDYEQAVRERVFIPQPGIDQDVDGVDDRIAIEVIRPAGVGRRPCGSPRSSSRARTTRRSCRGNEGECLGRRDADGLDDRWPLYYDNYFVPRGYAYVLAEMNGTATRRAARCTAARATSPA